MYICETGTNNKPAILFIHGAGGSGWMWQQQMNSLSDYHCLVPDLPEHGQSSAGEPFSMTDVISDIVTLIRNKAYGGSAHVVGLSLGGQITIELLSRYPDIVKSAIISGALVRPVKLVRALNPLLRMILSCYGPIVSSDFWTKVSMKAFTIPATYENNFRADMRLLNPDSFSRLLTDVMTYKLPPGLEKVTLPTLIVAGEKEFGVTRRSVSDLVAAIPKAQGTIALKMKHNWNMQDPGLFTRMVRAWIEQAPLPRELVSFA